MKRAIVSNSVWAAIMTLAALIAGSQAVAADKPAEKGTKATTGPEKRTADKPVTDDAKPAEADKPKGRLPNHYAAVVDDKQREKIDGIQADYAPQLEKIQTQLDALTAKRDAEIRNVLTKAQQKQVDALAAESEKNSKGDAKPNDDKAVAAKDAKADAKASTDKATSKVKKN